MGRKKTQGAKSPPPTVPVVTKRLNPSRLWQLLACATLGILTLLAYSNSFDAGFAKDNRFIILMDSRVHQASSENIDLIFHHTYWWPQVETGLYRPVTTLSYLFNYSVLGDEDRPDGYHWINFLLHFFNVLLVYALCSRLLQEFWPPIFIAAMWAVHPVLTESVTNIVGRADLQAALAVLSGLLIYLKSTDYEDWRRYAWLTGLMVVTTIGVFSKESAVAILGVIVLFEITFWSERKQTRGLVLGCAAVTIPILIMLYQRARVLAASAPAVHAFLDNPLYGVSFWKARLTAIAVIARYLWLLIWPATLSADYSYSQIPVVTGTFQDWLAWALVAALFVAVAIQFRKNRLCFFFGGFAFLTFVPASNLLFLTGTIMAERLMYLPSIGLAACVVIALFALNKRIRAPLLVPIVICLLITGLGVRTWERNIDWHDELSLATASVRSSPNSFRTHVTLAGLLGKSDPSGSNISQVIDELEKSMTILNSLPDSLNQVDVYATAGSAYQFQGDLLTHKGADGKLLVPTDSIRAYKKSLQALLRGVAIDKARGAVGPERLGELRKESAVSADAPTLYEQLAITYLRLGDSHNAYDTALYANSLDPSELQNYSIIAQELAREGRAEDAAIALVEGTLVSGQANFLNSLDVLYRAGLDPNHCAIRRTPAGDFLNNDCAPVHAEICRASAELIGKYRRNQRQDLADGVRSTATGRYGCPSTPRQ